MELTIIIAVAVAAVSQRIAVAVPLSLVVTGIALSFLPGLPSIAREAMQTRGDLAGTPTAGAADPREQYRRLMRQLLAAERAGLLTARSGGAYTSRTLSRAQHALDLAEAALQQIPDLADPESS